MKRQKKQNLSVSQNFYDGIMARIDSSMKAVRATQEETYQVKAYIYGRTNTTINTIATDCLIIKEKNFFIIP